MNIAALRLPHRVLRAELVLAAALFVALTVFGPTLLLLSDELARTTVYYALATLVPLQLVGFALTWLRLRSHRPLLRALALGSTSIDVKALDRLSQLPSYVTAVVIGLASTAVLIAFLAPLRPAVLDFDTVFSLALLGLIIVATAALPLYVAVRAAVARAIELATPDAVAALLEPSEAAERARRKLIWRLLIATATPVGFVAVGSSLIAHAHVRKFDADSRERTAEVISRVALEPVPGAVAEAGLAEAIAAARDLGFAARVQHNALKFAVERSEDGRVSLTTPLEDGAATIRFQVSSVSPITFADVVIALLGVALAAALGLSLGESLSSDLAQATQRVRVLGTEEVVFGTDRVAVRARYAQVNALNRAIDTLAARFRVFAQAQERAIDARDAARRLRSLLFASVSHDLRSPLNSILGFAGLVRQKPLSPPQRESLGFIEQSGRELLALIETILDSAKIEAGRMTLVRSKVSPVVVVAEAIRRGRRLAAARPLEFAVDVADGLPPIVGDEARLVQAVSALIWYAARSGEPQISAAGHVEPVTIKARSRTDPAGVVITVEAPNSPLTPEELERLLSPQPWVAGRRRYGGLTLGLALARSLVKLQRGRLDVKRSERGTTVFEVTLALYARSSAKVKTARRAEG